MKLVARRQVVLGAALVIVALLAADPARPNPFRVLMVSYSAGYQHEVVRRSASGLSVAEQVVTDLGQHSGRFTVTRVATRAELDALTAASVRAHQGILFFTTGELPLAPEVRQAIFAHVREGAGFVGVHSATDTWYDVPEYRRLVGGVFAGHPWHQRVTILVEDRLHPATRHLGAAFEITDEIYQFREWSRERVHVLLRLDPRSVEIGRGSRTDGDYALAWSTRYGRGHVVYTALGHDPAVWGDERFRAHLLGAIESVLPGR